MAEERFTIHQTGGSAALDRIASALDAEAAITHVSEESGRHYSVPDGDDLPEWTALRIYVETGDLDAYMEGLRARLVAKLGSDTLSAVTIARY